MQAEKERNDILEILRQLELVENKTDELIQRVLLKLKAIQQCVACKGRSCLD